MRLRGPAALAAAAVALAGGLAGCVSVLPKTPPVQLYRFGADAAAPQGNGAPVSAPALALAAVTLPRAAAGDGILTVTGDQAAYVAGARWVSPAAVLWEEAAQRAFADRASARVRLLPRGDQAGAAGLLRLDVRDFEARYPAPGAAPTVRVTLHATLSGPDGSPRADRTFAVERPAGENRLSAIVPAFDAAVRQALAEAATWVDAAATPLASRTAPAATPPARR